MGFLGNAGKLVGTAVLGGPMLAGAGLLAGALSPGINNEEAGLTANQNAIDPRTRELMNAQAARAAQDQDVYTNQQMQGVGNNPSVRAAQEQIGQQASSLGGPQATLGQALNARSTREYGQNQAQLQRAAALQAPLLQNKQQTQQQQYQAYDTSNALQQLQTQHNAANNMYAARAGIVSSIMGGAGAAGGMAYDYRTQNPVQPGAQDNPYAINDTKSGRGSFNTSTPSRNYSALS